MFWICEIEISMVDSSKGISSSTWFWTVLPINASLGGLLVVMPLIILALGGSVVSVGIAYTLYHLGGILGSIFWGYVIDQYHMRKLILTVSYLGTALLILSFFFTTNLFLLTLLFGLMSFFIVAHLPVNSMLLMESNPRESWSGLYSRMRTLTHVGFTVGIAPGIFWASFFDLEYYFLLLFAFAVLSVVLGQILVREPSIVLERKAIAHAEESLVHRLHHVTFSISTFFPKVPRITEFRRFLRLTKSSLTHRLPLLYAMVFFSLLGGSIFITSYIPFLSKEGVSYANVFIIIFIMEVVGTVVLPFVGRYSKKKGDESATQLALNTRLVSMILASILALSVFAVFEQSLLILALFSASFAIFYASSSSQLFKSLPDGKQGELLGVYSAVGGLACLMGSFASGYLSVSLGFFATFASAAMAIILALVVLQALKKTSI